MQLSSPQLGCVYSLFFFMVRNISLWFSGLVVCTLSLQLYLIQKVNYDALPVVWTFFFFKCFAIKHPSKHTFRVHYVVLWASCLKMITKKQNKKNPLFNYSWCDRYHVWRKSLEKRNRHCPSLFRMISLWKMQFLFPLKKKKKKTLSSHPLC